MTCVKKYYDVNVPDVPYLGVVDVTVSKDGYDNEFEVEQSNPGWNSLTKVQQDYILTHIEEEGTGG